MKTKIIHRERLRLPLVLFLASAIAWGGLAPRAARAANPFGVAYRRCVELLGSPSKLELQRVAAETNALREGTRFPSEFSAAEREALLREFKDDGRPILVVTDAHYGQKSGVVTVMQVLAEKVEKLTDGKVKIKYVMPDQFKPRVELKNMQELIFAWMSSSKFRKIVADTDPQAVHVMVEGSLGWQARKVLLGDRIPFTTAYHTMFPEYVRDMVAKYADWAAEPTRRMVNRNLRKFHSVSEGVMVPTESMARNLIENGYDPARIRYWSHGVDIDLFHPSMRDESLFKGLPRPISIFVGRVAIEKNIEDFLKMEIPGSKVVVGSGPELEILKKKYPSAVFLGRKNYQELGKYYASSDVFVFPSTTDTFGLVQLESTATGTPVVAYNVQGPVDVITSPSAGRLADWKEGAGDANVKSLEKAWHETVGLDREKVRAFSEEHTWEQSALEFLYFLRRFEKNPR